MENKAETLETTTNKSGTRIEYFTIEQSRGTMKFQSGADFENTLAEMRLDNSVVWLKAYRGGQSVTTWTSESSKN